jgi:peroxiredoxin Q/BCP
VIPNIDSIRIIGVSPDSPKSHIKFRDKYSLNFTLLADTKHELAEACGVWVEKMNYGRPYMGVERSTFAIDENGIVTKVWRKVKAQGHAHEVAAAI